MSDTILRVEHIDKRFVGVHALKQVSFDVREGEVHALMGENGAGKSTLMKILTGIYKADSGSIFYKGELFTPHGPKDSLAHGIGIIHQELNMMDHLTVAQNIFIGREPVKMGGLFIDEVELNKQAKNLLERLNMNIDPRTKLRDLTVGKQQMVEIAKAVSHDLNVLILDEPTAALTTTEIEDLFVIMRDLQKSGVGMIYISHRMDELKRITQRVTVMRDGEYIGTRVTDKVTQDDIIHMMVGRTLFEEPKMKSNVSWDDPTVLKVTNLCAGKMVQDINFSLRKGEILGFAGLMGAGRTETLRAVFGADPKESGGIELHGTPVKIDSPVDAVSLGVGYLSEDRKRYGLALGLSLTTNTVMATYNKHSKGLFVNRKKEVATAEEYRDVLNIRTPSVAQLAKNLSGGNQQKVVLAKWLVRDCDIIIFDEPTRGIDVGAKSEIYALMNQLVEQGKSIIMISSELSEILRMSDRVIVMCEGRITKALDIADADQETIMKYATKREEN